MNTVYLLEWFEYDFSQVIGIFSSLEKAKAHATNGGNLEDGEKLEWSVEDEKTIFGSVNGDEYDGYRVTMMLIE